MPKRRPPPDLDDDVIDWLEDKIQAADENETFAIDTEVAAHILARLKLAKRSRRGRKPTTGRQRAREMMDVDAARALKAQMIADAKAQSYKVKADDAAEEAAKSVARLNRSGLSATEIQYRIIRPGNKNPDKKYRQNVVISVRMIRHTGHKPRI